MSNFRETYYFHYFFSNFVSKFRPFSHSENGNSGDTSSDSLIYVGTTYNDEMKIKDDADSKLNTSDTSSICARMGAMNLGNFSRYSDLIVHVNSCSVKLMLWIHSFSNAEYFYSKTQSCKVGSWCSTRFGSIHYSKYWCCFSQPNVWRWKYQSIHHHFSPEPVHGWHLQSDWIWFSVWSCSTPRLTSKQFRPQFINN